ncbi:hypothetical protein GHT07_14135 [Caenimonas koreensis DSM 17982]|uniref:Uncharacterized protein n=1 Tax=Caenimonas koreensis DSM 17982 TaxID=1121255 RepID=A0A844B5E3_9BURK|nr:hypothetical protein [Caenimonas koreensis]MRD48422.1 hypothetical protein [Caenimonas koreensis DSM 17982]
MAITMFSFGSLFAPLNGLLSWFAPTSGATAAPASQGSICVDTRPAVFRSARLRASRPLAAPNCRKSTRPLRVFRARGDSPASAAMGMALSGSMADVCAELERLAALESIAAH